MDLKDLLKLSGNDKCVDCGDLKPSWGSIIVPPKEVPEEHRQFIGCFICMHCSGAHRALGTHICFVKSITLDTWSDRDLEAMRLGGNLRVNSIFEALMFDDSEKPSPCDDMQTRESFIRDKYINHKYFVPAWYKVIGTEDEDEDDENEDGTGGVAVTGDRNTQPQHQGSAAISVLSSPSVQARLAGESIVGSGSCVASVSVEGDSLSGSFNTKSSSSSEFSSIKSPAKKISRRDLMSRQYSLPTIHSPRMLSDPSAISPAKRDDDIFESMNNSQWGIMTFEESVRTRSTVDLETKSTNDAWNLSGHNPTGETKGLHSSSKSEAGRNKDKMKGRRPGLERPKSARSLFKSGSGDLTSDRKSKSSRALMLDSMPSARQVPSQLPSCDEEKNDNDGDTRASFSHQFDSKGTKTAAAKSTDDVLQMLEEASKSRLLETPKRIASRAHPPLHRQLSSPVLSPTCSTEKVKIARSRSSEGKRKGSTKKHGQTDNLAAFSMSMSNVASMKTPTSRRRKTTREAEKTNDRYSMSCNFNYTTSLSSYSPQPSSLDTHSEERIEGDLIDLLLSPEVKMKPRRNRSSKSPGTRSRLKSTTKQHLPHVSSDATRSASMCESTNPIRSAQRKRDSKSPKTKNQPIRPASLHVQEMTQCDSDDGPSSGRRRTNSLDAVTKSRRRTDTRGKNKAELFDVQVPMGMPSFAVSGGASRIPRQVSDPDRRSSDRKKTTLADIKMEAGSKSPRTHRGRKAAVLHAHNQEIIDREKEKRPSGSSSSPTWALLAETNQKSESRPRSLDVSRRRRERRARTREATALCRASYHPQERPFSTTTRDNSKGHEVEAEECDDFVVEEEEEEEEGDDDILSDEECLRNCKPSSSTSTTDESNGSSGTLHDSEASFASQ